MNLSDRFEFEEPAAEGEQPGRNPVAGDQGSSEPEQETLKAPVFPVETPAELGERVNVTECGSCGGIHDRTLLHQYAHPVTPYTHWYRCVTTGDPVPLCITRVGKTVALEVGNAIVRQVVSACLDDRYMIVVWRVHPDPANPDGTELTMEPPIYKEFPTEDPLVGFGAALGMLERKLTEAIGRPIRSAAAEQPAMLQEAKTRIPMVRMFGENRLGDGQ